MIAYLVKKSSLSHKETDPTVHTKRNMLRGKHNVAGHGALESRAQGRLWTSGRTFTCVQAAEQSSPPLPARLQPHISPLRSAPSKRSCCSNPRKSRLHWPKWLCSVHKHWVCVLTRDLGAPLAQGYAIPPGCGPGYWVRPALGEALFWEGGGRLVNPREPPTSSCLLSLHRHEQKKKSLT